MIICEVRQGSGTYIFKSKFYIREQSWVLCDTRIGKQPGFVTDCFEADEHSPLFKRYLRRMGATEPLKDIIGIFVPMETLDEIRKRNRK